MSCSSSPIFLRARDDQRSLDLEYPELSSRLFIGNQNVSRKEKWNKLNLEYQLFKGVWPKRRKGLKNGLEADILSSNRRQKKS